MPAAQPSHWSAPQPEEKAPGAHSEQELAAPPYRPGTHGEHAVNPASDEKLPAPHAVQVVAPRAVPYVPAPHPPHAGAPVTAEKEPA